MRSPQRHEQHADGDPLASSVFKFYIIAVFALLTLAFWLPVQDFLIHLLMRLGWDAFLQKTTVPYELRFVSTLLTLLGFPIKTGNEYITWQTALGKQEFLYFTWNCGGWQSFLLFFASAIAGLRGKHTLFSKWETAILGIVGTYLFTMFRLMAVLVVYLLVGRPLGILFHDYLTIFFTFGYLALFWWLAYRFMLKEQLGSTPPLHRQVASLVFGRGAVALVITLAILANYLVFFPRVPVAHAAGQPTIEQQINILDATLTAGTSGYVLIDTANYAGSSVTYYFEVDALVTSGTGTAVLTYNAGTGSAPSGGSTLTISNINTTSYARYRSSSFSPTGAQNAYISSLTGTGISVQAARIIVVQTDPTSINNSVTQIEIGNQESAGSLSTDNPLTKPKYWKWDSSKYDGTVNVYFEATLSIVSTQGISASLYPSGATCNGIVTGSTLTPSSTGRLRSADISAHLTTGTSYMVCLNKNSATIGGTLIDAKLIIQQTSTAGLTKMEMQHIYINTAATNSTSTYTSQNFLNQYNPSDWAGGTFTYYFESTLKTSAGTAFSQLYNNTDASAITGSEITTTNTSATLVRSGSITMPSAAKDMDTQIKNSATNTTTVEGSWLIIDVSSLQTPENVLAFLPLALFIPALVRYFRKRRQSIGAAQQGK